MTTAEIIYLTILIVFIINFFMILFLVFLERKDPKSILPWIFAFLAFPILSWIIYFFVGKGPKINRKRWSRQKKIADNMIAHEFAYGNLKSYESDDREIRELIKLNSNEYLQCTTYNETKIYTDAHEMYEDQIKDIKEAKETVFVLYYLFKKDDAELIKELYSTGDEESSKTTENTNSNTSKNTTTNTTNNTATNSTTNNTVKNNTTTTGNTTSSNSISKTEAAKVKIEILNGSNSSATLIAVKKALAVKGYKVTKTTNTTETEKTTIINKSNVNENITENIKDILGAGTVSSSSVSSSNVDITIIIGKDYK